MKTNILRRTTCTWKIDLYGWFKVIQVCQYFSTAVLALHSSADARHCSSAAMAAILSRMKPVMFSWSNSSSSFYQDQVFSHRSLPIGLSAAHFSAHLLLDWSLAVKWAPLQITTTAAYPSRLRSNHDETTTLSIMGSHHSQGGSTGPGQKMSHFVLKKNCASKIKTSSFSSRTSAAT